jgi:quercetin dioxygenase-like cupin family protein
MIPKLNWDTVPVEEVNPSMSRQIVCGEKLMIARIKFKDGFLVPKHSHMHEQVTQVISGKMRFWFGENKEETMDLNPGDVIVIPSDLPHEALMIGDVEEVDTWAPPRQDWLDKSDGYLRATVSR